MGDPIRAALERLIKDTEYLVKGGEDLDRVWAAIAAGKAALAEQQVEGPSHGDICQWLERQGHWGDNAHRIPRIANMVQDALARWGHQPAPTGHRGVLPMIITDTGASDECERERIICASISGGADYINNMPRMLTLEKINSEGSTYQQYIQDPTPPAEVDALRQDPEAFEWEVWRDECEDPVLERPEGEVQP